MIRLWLGMLLQEALQGKSDVKSSRMDGAAKVQHANTELGSILSMKGICLYAIAMLRSSGTKEDI